MTDHLSGLFSPVTRESLIALRRDLHQHPELAFSESRTAAALERALAALNPVSVQRVAGTGVVARIRGLRSDAPVVAVRGDIDALPIHEATGLSFASVNAGVMHACGHDVHATWAVGAAHLLTERPAEGDVLVVLQPAEETGEGAAAVLASGALDAVKAIFGAHVDRRFIVGEVVAQAGPLAASADNFEIVLAGRGEVVDEDGNIGLAAGVIELEPDVIGAEFEIRQHLFDRLARYQRGEFPSGQRGRVGDQFAREMKRGFDAAATDDEFVPSALFMGFKAEARPAAAVTVRLVDAAQRVMDFVRQV